MIGRHVVRKRGLDRGVTIRIVAWTTWTWCPARTKGRIEGGWERVRRGLQHPSVY